MRMRQRNWSVCASVFGLTGGCLAMLTACSDQPLGGVSEDIGETSEGVIIGANDLVRVGANGKNVPAKYAPVVNAIGRLSKSATGSGFCSATHLGHGIGVSAGHCWSAGATEQTNISCTSGSTCNGHVVQWGATSDGIASVSKITRIRAMRVSSGTNRLDYAYFDVDPIPPDFIGIDWSGKAKAGTTLTIFSHPGGRTQEWSTTCPLQNPGQTQLTYQCDTEGGSSGASVLNDANLMVQAIHWGGASSGNSATFIHSTPVPPILQPDGGVPDGGTGGGDGGDGGKADGDGGKADGGDASLDAPTDGSTDAPGEGGGGAAGSAGAAGAAGAAGSAGTAGASGTGGAAGTGGAGGKGGASGGGTGGGSGAGGKAGGSGAGGATGGGAGTGGAGGSGGSTAGASGTGGSGGGSAGTSSGKGGTSTGGSGGSTGGDDGGCSCRVGPGATPTGDGALRGVFAAVALGLAGTLRRARRKSRR